MFRTDRMRVQLDFTATPLLRHDQGSQICARAFAVKSLRHCADKNQQNTFSNIGRPPGFSAEEGVVCDKLGKGPHDERRLR